MFCGLDLDAGGFCDRPGRWPVMERWRSRIPGWFATTSRRGSWSLSYFITLRKQLEPPISLQRLAENRRLPHGFIAACPFWPSPLTRVDYQALPDEVLDRFVNWAPYFSRICRPVFSSHNNIPSLVLSSRSFDCHPAPWFSLRSIWVASRNHLRVAATSSVYRPCL